MSDDVDERLEELRPAAGRNVFDLLTAGLLVAATVLTYSAAAVRWPGSAVAWGALGLGIGLLAFGRAFGAPWGADE